MIVKLRSHNKIIAIALIYFMYSYGTETLQRNCYNYGSETAITHNDIIESIASTVLYFIVYVTLHYKRFNEDIVTITVVIVFLAMIAMISMCVIAA